MKAILFHMFFLVFTLSGAALLQSQYDSVRMHPYASTQPMSKPVIFGEGVVSTGDYESHPAFTPDGRALSFVKSTRTVVSGRVRKFRPHALAYFPYMKRRTCGIVAAWRHWLAQQRSADPHAVLAAAERGLKALWGALDDVSLEGAACAAD